MEDKQIDTWTGEGGSAKPAESGSKSDKDNKGGKASGVAPSIGRIVHLYAPELSPGPHAGIITGISPGRIAVNAQVNGAQEPSKPDSFRDLDVLRGRSMGNTFLVPEIGDKPPGEAAVLSGPVACWPPRS